MSEMDIVLNALKCGIRKNVGEITASVSSEEDKKIYALNCAFCATICLQLEAFVLHMDDYHQEIFYEYIEANEGEEKEEVQDLKSFTVCTEIEQMTPGSTQSQKEQIKFELCVEETEEFESIYQEEISEISDVEVNIKKGLKQLNEHRLLEDLSDDCDSKCDIEDKVQQSSEVEDSTASDFEEGEDDDDKHEDDKKVILALIAGYKKHQLLWHADDPMARKVKKREEAFRKIATSIKQRTGAELSWQSIRVRIKRIRYKYRRELQNQKVAEQRNEKYTPPWYYEHLAFLNTSVKYKQRNKRGAKALSNEKFALPLPNLTDVQNIQLIDIYKSYPSLWDVEHIGFRFKTQRQEALDGMLSEIKTKMNLTFTQNELQKKLYRIRYACTQDKHRQMQCECAHDPFKPSCKLYDQIAFLLPHVGPFKCSYCAQIFNGADQYKIHISKHDGSMPFTCPMCKRGFMKVGNCTVHLRRHTRDYPFECQECGKRFATTTDINVHRRYHTGEKPYFCEVCGQSFRTWTFFDAHMRRHQKRPNHKCTICSKAFYENNKLTEHMKAHMNVRDKVCNVCGKAFTSAKYLRQHKQIHAEKKKYVCKICNKDFAQYAGLSGHMKSHGTTVNGARADD